jgi:hypothetical protein
MPLSGGAVKLFLSISVSSRYGFWYRKKKWKSNQILCCHRKKRGWKINKNPHEAGFVFLKRSG